MKSLYNKNSLMFWTQDEIQLREMFQKFFATGIHTVLKTMNPAFEMMQVEASQLTPRELIDVVYTDEDIYMIDDELALRPETTMGSFVYAKEILNTHNDRKVRMPLCVWQHGKSFRKEQDNTVANMRLKEFYQLEFQIIFSKTTANDYYPAIVDATQKMIAQMIGACHTEASDRLPRYSTETTDVVLDSNSMELCSISRRTDFDNAHVIEVAIGTDRVVYNFLNK